MLADTALNVEYIDVSDKLWTPIGQRMNVDGGTIAIGHPPVMTTLVNALEQRGGRYGL